MLHASSIIRNNCKKVIIMINFLDNWLDSWEEKYCKNIEKNLVEVTLVSVALDGLNMNIDIALKNKTLPVQERYAIQVGYIISELQKLYDFSQMESRQRIYLVMSTLAYWYVKKGIYHTEKEVLSLSDIYSKALKVGNFDLERNLGFDYSQSNDNWELLNEFLNNKGNENFNYGVELGIKKLKDMKDRDEAVKLSDIINIAQEKHSDCAKEVIDGFMHQMNLYVEDNHIRILKSQNDLIYILNA